LGDDADVVFKMATRARGRGNEAVNATSKDLRLQALAAADKLKGTQPPFPLHTPQSSRTRPLSGLSQPVQEEPSPPHTPQMSSTLPLWVWGGM